MPQYDHESTTICVCGKRGHGKTIFAYRYIQGSDHDCFFIFDERGQFAERQKTAAAFTPEQLDAQFKRRFVVFNPAEMFPGRRAAAFEFFNEWTFEKCGTIPGKKLLFADELQKYTDAKSIGPCFSTNVETGRHVGLDLLCTTLAFNRIHNAVHGQATEWVTFQITTERQLKPLLEIGFEKEEVIALPKFHYLGRTDRGDFYKGTVAP
jgi:hypothetical protein